MGTLRIFELHTTQKLSFAEKMNNGEIVTVRFTPVVMFGRVEPSIFATNNEELAQKIMQRSDFGSYILLRSGLRYLLLYPEQGVNSRGG